MGLLNLFRGVEPQYKQPNMITSLGAMISEAAIVRGVKAIYDAIRVGVSGRAKAPAADVHSLLTWQRRNELAFACIEKIKDCAIDPTLIVEQRQGESYKRIEAHPLAQLFRRPNPEMAGSEFLAWWLVSLHVAGRFYAEIVRSRDGLPVGLWPLHPGKVRAVASATPYGHAITAYEFVDGTTKIRIPAENMFVDKFADIGNPYDAISPLAVALGACDMDSAQTDYVRAFFESGGVPSGVIRVTGRTLKKEETEGILAGWMAKYRRGSGLQNAPAVLDQNAEYQKIGANLDELESAALREHGEARICTCFGVPPVLVGALVGLKHQNNRASAYAAQAEFWANKMSPLFKRLRTVLTWRLLTEFESEAAIHGGLVRINWDMSQVVALQENETERQDRARKNLLAGAITLREFREIIGAKTGPKDDYYLRSRSHMPVTPEQAAAVAAREAEPEPASEAIQ